MPDIAALSSLKSHGNCARARETTKWAPQRLRARESRQVLRDSGAKRAGSSCLLPDDRGGGAIEVVELLDGRDVPLGALLGGETRCHLEQLHGEAWSNTRAREACHGWVRPQWNARRV
eukprot:4752251-Pleurochrysis_carterae.AAC.6